MGLLKALDRHAGAVATGRSTSRTQVITTNKRTRAALQAFPVKMRNKVLRKAVRRAGSIVVKSARTNLAGKRSRDTGTRDLWSKKVRDRRAGLWDLYKSIGTRVKNYKATSGSGAIASFNGPRWPTGAHGHLVELGGYHPYWGGPGGEYEPPHPFLRRAAQETSTQQQRVIEAIVLTEWETI